MKTQTLHEAKFLTVLQVLDDGQVLVRASDGYLETWQVPIERVPQYRRLIDKVLPIQAKRMRRPHGNAHS